LEHFEKHHSFEVLKKEETTKEKAHETIKEFVKKLHQDIENLPEVQQEAKIHHQPLEDVTNILSTALEITLSVGILEGLNFIRKIGNP
jgi:rhamnogalacturonyl hydrolase YesR